MKRSSRSSSSQSSLKDEAPRKWRTGSEAIQAKALETAVWMEPRSRSPARRMVVTTYAGRRPTRSSFAAQASIVPSRSPEKRRSATAMRVLQSGSSWVRTTSTATATRRRAVAILGAHEPVGEEVDVAAHLGEPDVVERVEAVA